MTNEIVCCARLEFAEPEAKPEFATETDRSGLFIGPIAVLWRGHFPP